MLHATIPTSGLLQVLQRSVAVSRRRRGEENDWELIGQGLVPQRMFTLQEVHMLANAAGFSVEGLYGEMDMQIGLQHEDAYRLVAVLRSEKQCEMTCIRARESLRDNV